MALYLENTAFGCGAFELTGITAAAGLVYAGQAEGAQAKEATAKAIDLSKWSGNYKDRSWIRINTVKQIVGPTKYVDIYVYYCKTDATTTANVTCYDMHRIPISVINGAKTTPIEISLPSVGGTDCEFVRLGVSADAAVTAGAIRATIEATRL